ncbi:MAG TPA: sulfotransferase family protein [Phycisphaerales bacterium]|nr:sulfotransferase family protein [Phycisphaerales bacterium]
MPGESRQIPPAVKRRLYEAHGLKMKYHLEQAARAYRAILADHPDLPAALAGLGHTIGMAGKPKQGIAMLRRALELDPDNPEVHLYLGELIFKAHDPETALTHLEKTIEAEPKNVGALMIAASCLERLNRLDEALDHAERAVRAKRTDPEAILMLATVESRLKRYDDARPRLEKLIARSSTPRTIHHRALTELGFLLDKCGEYDAAYEAFDRAGREIAETPEVKKINPDLVSMRIDAYRGRVSRELVSRFEGVEFDTPAPAFLVGFPRSGTTMTEQILAAHPGVVSSDERPLLNPMGRALVANMKNRIDVPAALERLDEKETARLRRVYWDAAAELFDADADGRLFVDKLPLNIIDLAMINTIFPDARVIVALRDPRDVCLSCFMQWFVPNPAMIRLLTLESSAAFYREVMSLYLELEDVLSIGLCRVRYEDTVTDLESQARGIIAHLGLDWHDDLLRFQEKAKQRAIRTPSYAAVTEKVHTRAVGRWHNYEAHFQPIRETLAPFVAAFGYEQDMIKRD